MPKVNNNGRLNQAQREETYNFDTEVSLIQAFIPIGIMAVEELLYKEVEALAGPLHHRKDNNGNPVSSGMYFYRLDAISKESDKELHETKKMVLLR